MARPSLIVAFLLASATALAHDEDLRATFKLYPGVAHSVTPEIAEDIARFFSDR